MNDDKIIFEGKLEVPKEFGSIMTKEEIKSMVINKIVRKVDRALRDASAENKNIKIKLDIVAIDDTGKKTDLLSKVKEK
ncbi:MAG: hypothetical protein ACTSPI_00705 [Candidatus Heimdallarchaeaceae archaeon]